MEHPSILEFAAEMFKIMESAEKEMGSSIEVFFFVKAMRFAITRF